MEINIDDEKLIYLVQLNENLYNKFAFGYKSNFVKDAVWKKIGKELGASEKQCQRRWTTLRDRYSRERRRVQVPDDERWPLFDAMHFIDKHVKARPTRCLAKIGEEQILPNSFRSPSPSTSLSSLPLTSSELPFDTLSLTSLLSGAIQKKSSKKRKAASADTNEFREAVEALKKNTVKESFSSPTTQCSSDSSYVPNKFFNYDAGEVIPTPTTKNTKRAPSYTLASPQNSEQTGLKNEISYCQPHIPAKDRWKTVFSEYILCELDRYDYHDGQKLKNQLTMVCLNFQPTQKMIENVNETEFMICKIEENVEDGNEDIGGVEKRAEDFLDINMKHKESVINSRRAPVVNRLHVTKAGKMVSSILSHNTINDTETVDSFTGALDY